MKTLMSAFAAFFLITSPALYADHQEKHECTCDKACKEKCKDGKSKDCKCKGCDCGKGESCSHCSGGAHEEKHDHDHEHDAVNKANPKKK